MATADYLAAIRSVYPNVQEDQGLIDELNRRSGENASTDAVLNDAAGYYQVQQGNQAAAEKDAAAQVDPAYRVAADNLNQQKTDAQANADKLQASIAKAYQARRENDGLAKQGIASGAAQDYVTGQQVGDIRSASDDLTSKLSAIAQQLNTAGANAATQKAGIVSGDLGTYRANAGTALQTRLQNAVAQQQADFAAKQYADQQAQQQYQNQFGEKQFAADTAYKQQQLAIDQQKAAASASSGIGSDPATQALIAQLLGGGSGTSSASASVPAPKISAADAQKELTQLFSSNYASSAGKDQQLIAGIQQETGLDQQAAAALFYNARKPFEAQAPSASPSPAR